jgi:hypothetical protein
VFSVLINAQNVIQEFSFNGTLSNTSNTISFLGDAKFVKDRTGTVNGALRIVNNVLEAPILIYLYLILKERFLFG